MGIAKVSVRHDLCIGSGQCILTAPNAFVLDDMRRSTVKMAEGDAVPGPVDRPSLRNDVTDDMLLAAAQACPVKAIELFDEEGRKITP